MLAVERRLTQADPTLLATGVAAIVAALLMLLGLPVGVTAAAGALLGLVLPGYALVRAMFPNGRTDPFERVALVLGVSVSVAICGGFLLHLLPMGLSAASWGLLLAGITVAACVASARRDRRVYRQGLSLPTMLAVIGKLPPGQLAMLVAALLLPVCALFVARFGEGSQPRPTTTTAWVRPTLDGSSVRVGISNEEGRNMTYRVEIGVDRAVVARLDSFGVSGGTTRETRVGLPDTGEAREVTIRVWRAEDVADAVPYRSLGIRVSSGGDDVAEPGENSPPLLVPPGESRAE
jgi:uncharacterized membrane protein